MTRSLTFPYSFWFIWKNCNIYLLRFCFFFFFFCFFVFFLQIYFASRNFRTVLIREMDRNIAFLYVILLVQSCVYCKLYKFWSDVALIGLIRLCNVYSMISFSYSENLGMKGYKLLYVLRLQWFNTWCKFTLYFYQRLTLHTSFSA